MQPIDLEVITQVVNWLEDGQPCWHCTVVGTYGSSPRPIGSLFATNGNQRVGSISGGCLEDYFIEQLSAGSFTKGASIYTYGRVEGIDGRLELPCGGTIRLLIEYLKPNKSNRIHFQKLVDKFVEYTPFNRIVFLPSGETLLNTGVGCALETGYSNDQANIYYSQPWQILILGASSVAEYVAKFALDCGYKVQLCDCREEAIDSWKVEQVTPEYNYSNLFIERQPSLKYSAVLALAHDPRVDDMGLMEALKSDSFYVGAMGSQRTSAARRDRLLRSGDITQCQLDCLHAPIGLSINSKTPAEIAISIMADITLARKIRHSGDLEHGKAEKHSAGTGSRI